MSQSGEALLGPLAQPGEVVYNNPYVEGYADLGNSGSQGDVFDSSQPYTLFSKAQIVRNGMRTMGSRICIRFKSQSQVHANNYVRSLGKHGILINENGIYKVYLALGHEKTCLENLGGMHGGEVIKTNVMKARNFPEQKSEPRLSRSSNSSISSQTAPTAPARAADSKNTLALTPGEILFEVKLERKNFVDLPHRIKLFPFIRRTTYDKQMESKMKPMLGLRIEGDMNARYFSDHIAKISGSKCRIEKDEKCSTVWVPRGHDDKVYAELKKIGFQEGEIAEMRQAFAEEEEKANPKPKEVKGKPVDQKEILSKLKDVTCAISDNPFRMRDRSNGDMSCSIRLDFETKEAAKQFLLNLRGIRGCVHIEEKVVNAQLQSNYSVYIDQRDQAKFVNEVILKFDLKKNNANLQQYLTNRITGPKYHGCCLFNFFFSQFKYSINDKVAAGLFYLLKGADAAYQSRHARACSEDGDLGWAIDSDFDGVKPIPNTRPASRR